MATADDTFTMSKHGRRAVATGTDERASHHIEGELASDRTSRDEAWQRLIDRPLIDWGRDPAQLEDDGLTAPTQERIVQAIKIAYTLRSENWPPPRRIVPDGEGGIVFEYRDGSDSASLCISEDGSVEFAVFNNGSLVSRQQIQLN